VSGKTRSYGLLAEFHSPGAVVSAAHVAHSAGYRKLDAYTPYPIEELAEALGVHHSPLPKMILAGGILGAVAGFGLQYWASVIAYPLNIGGRPLNSWVAFIPPTFETTVLFAAATAVFGMIAVNGLPQPYHPVFNVPAFALASRDRFFLIVEASDPKFDREATRRFLEALPEVTAVHEVEP
jgi:hypothetical protein